jgi:glycosyltransferase involved in cell wall biosynthesis
MTIRVLCLDIEGGYGGSSRSLYESIQNLPDGDVEVEVWCRRDGPIIARYEAIGVTCCVMPDMPHIGALPRLSRNLYVFSRFALFWWKSSGFRARLESAVRHEFDVVHFNHEGLFLLARWLRNRVGKTAALVVHIRTLLPSTLFSRWQYRTIGRIASRCIYITEMEQENAVRLSAINSKGPVIYNIVSPTPALEPDPAVAKRIEFKLASISNYAWLRGNDRLIDVAVELKQRGREEFVFVVAGRMELTGNLPGLLGELAASGGTLRDYAERLDVAHLFHFLGPVPDPSPVLRACDLLVRPSRNNDPWGREVLEAMMHGLPVIAMGEYNKFVESGVTGYLHAKFDAGAFADNIIALADRDEVRAAMSAASRDRVSVLCDGPARSSDLAQVWHDLSERP